MLTGKPRGRPGNGAHTLSPEHVDIVDLCRDAPQSVAELSAELNLPIGVIRVLIGDLVDAEFVHVNRPVPRRNCRTRASCAM
ncbi:hypothetical protein SALBM311S_12233 [Streptomyces alboniger]